MQRPVRTLECLHALVLMIAIVGAGFWCMDVLTAAPDAGANGSAESLDESRFHAGPRRAFVLVVDSLRYQTAIDPEVMPNLVALQERSTVSEMKTVHDAVTVPALRAAFTGREQVTVFGFVRNLWHGTGGFASMFTQARDAGVRSLVYSDGSFEQFGNDLPDQRNIGQGAVEESQSVETALEAFLDGSCDLVLAHILFSDAAAHRAAVHSESYREAFGMVDELVRTLDESIPEDATLVVMGDHGHDELGRHIVGMDVPTLAVYRGPGFAKGMDLGTTHIADTRYLMSWALKLTLPGDYPAGRYPEALRGVDEIPSPFLASAPGATVDDGDGGLPPNRWIDFALATIALAMLVSIWFGIVRPRDRPDRVVLLSGVGAWLAIVLLVIWGGQRMGLAAAVVVVALALCAPMLHRGLSRGEVLWAFVPTAVWLFIPWGYLLSAVRPWVGWPRYRAITVVWAATVGLGLLLSLRIGAMNAIWALLAFTGLLFYPTVYPYGTPAAMVPVWAAMLLYTFVEDVRWNRRSPIALADEPRGVSRYALVLPILVLIVPFGLVYSVNFRFVAWFVPVMSEGLWGDHREAVRPTGLALAFLAKLIIFVRWRAGVLVPIAGVLAAAALQAVQMRWTGLAPEETPRWAFTGGIGACVLVALVAGRLRDPRWRGIARVAWLMMLYLIYLYTIRLDIRFYLWADCLLAAIFLTGLLYATESTCKRRPTVYLVLLVLAALMTGWVTLGWTFHRLEWGFLFDWFNIHFVERKAGLFAVAITLPFCIPVIVARIMLSEALADRWTYPQRWITLVSGLKVFATLMVALGLGFHQVGTDAYMEAVQQTTIWTIVILALPWRFPAARPGPS